ncbi:PAS domain-containing protein, partial [Hymenobacter profundi]
MTLPPLDLLPVFNAQPGATLLLSPDWVILGASDDYLAATLTERTTIVGQHIFDAFPDNPETPEANAVANVRASLETVLATKQPHAMAPQHYDVPDRTRPGRFIERHWQPRHTPVLNAQGQVQCIIQSVQDITARRLAERQLRESQAAEQAAHAVAVQQRHRFREVLTQMPAYIAVYQGPDHIYQFVNPTYQSLFPHRSFLGRPFREGTPEAVELGIVALFDQVYRTGEPVYLREMEGWFDFHGNGQLVQVFLNISLHPLRDVGGHIDGVMDFTYDVSEQVRARQQVEQLNQQLEAARDEAEAERQRLTQVLMRMPANIALLRGPEHIYDLVNAEYERLFPARTTLGRTIREVIPDIEGQGFYELFDRVYETGEPFYEAETEAWADFAGTGEPQRRYYRTTFEPIRDAQGQVTEVLNFAV